METNKATRHTLRAWLYVSLLLVLAAVLGALQYRWIGEVSLAERDRLRAGLRSSLQRLSQDFNAEISSACAAMLAGGPAREEGDRELAYASNFAHWKETSRHGRLIRGVALAALKGGAVQLKRLDMETEEFTSAQWPEAWSGVREMLTPQMPGSPPGARRPPGPPDAGVRDLVAIPVPRLVRPPGEDRTGPGSAPRRDRGEPRPPFELEWLLIELDLDYVRSTLLPELLERHLGEAGKSEYMVEIVSRTEPPDLIYASHAAGGERISPRADASVGLFEVQYGLVYRRLEPFRERGKKAGPERGRFPGPDPPSLPDRGRWLLSVRHQAGSLEAVVERARWRNLAVAGAILGTMLAAIGALVRYTGRAQRLAQLQMDFVAGVSHELRTPLSVIRTAAHNLGEGVVTASAQVKRYGVLIEEEAARLTGIVEQVLRFAGVKAGRAIGAREPVRVESLVEDALSATAALIQESGCEVEKQIEDGLPPVLADPIALKHAIQNLLTNAAKYGSEGGWIGLSASKTANGKGPAVEIRVADRGRGIPREELGHIFDPFYRGRRAIEDQIHGTGLGLNLVKRIVEAHEGTVTVESEPDRGTRFVLRIPATPAA